ncbi:restriction endonuclease subunit S [Sedimenticola hydrogenitrophicus]|uniref:restriction endonuclease subunit S n=1 Tax=Sedimenticola hydrogenitrophicus TaxID=2967975 RepID=UPI0023B1B596|nr:restriction endonuclease subunit S [Sedimenticola hydrogenitrophicus]
MNPGVMMASHEGTKTRRKAARRLKYAATINDESLTEATEPDYELQYIDIGNVDSYGTVHDVVAYKFEDAPSRARRIARHGDVIVSTVRTYLQAIAPIENPPENLIVSTGFAVVRPKGNLFDARFCKYAVREKHFLWEVESRSVGVSYPAINASDLADIRISLPAIDTQRLIADYLDRETVRIDALVAEKEKMAALLDEKRAALISRAVTRGLNPNAPLKPSGLDWLGDIPAHWETPPVYARFEVQLGKMLDEKKIKGTHLAPYLRNIDVQWGTINTSSLPEMDFDDESRVRYSLQPGDILVCEGGEIGRSAIWFGEIAECYYQKALHRLRPLNGYDNASFFVYVMQALVNLCVFSSQANAATIQHLPAEKLRTVRYPAPPIHEQREIVSFLNRETAHLEKMDSEITHSIQLLKERRAALITSTVTGQIDIEQKQTKAGGRHEN